MRLLLLLLLAFPAFAQEQLGSGLVLRGQIGNVGGCGSGSARLDAQVEIINCVPGRHALVSIYQDDPYDEAAISYGSRQADGYPVQVSSTFSRMYQGYNGANWQSVFGIHSVGHHQDSTTFLSYSNNSVRLAYGPTAALPWTSIPPDNTVELGRVYLKFNEAPAHPQAIAGSFQVYQLNGALWAMSPSGQLKQIAP